MNDEQKKMWEKLNHVPEPPPFMFDFDVSSMYMAQVMNVFHVSRVEWKEGDLVTIKVLKSR